MLVEICVLGASFTVSAVLTNVIRKRELARGTLDMPNARSSHSVPTPRGGGLSIVVATSAAAIVLLLLGAVDRDLFLALLGGVAIAIVGYVDDRRSVAPKLRLLVHFAAALWAVAWLGGLPQLQFGAQPISLGAWGYVLGSVGVVWTLNLFNFMDGIDGIAASEAIFVTVAAAAIALLFDGLSAVSLMALAVAAACGGFLVWNWPPARIFMGDVGSGYLGYVIAVLALAHARENPVALLIWVILGATFFIDATVTLVRRLSRGEAAHQAHRSHAYQWLARRWGSHRRVTVMVCAVNVMWLLPCALLANAYRGVAGWIVLGALLPVGLGVFAAGAGRPERPA